MNKKSFKTKLFGYGKMEVYEYISEVNLEFSQKLAEKQTELDALAESSEAKLAAAKAEYQAKEEALLRQIEELKAECAEYRAQRDIVADTILEAQEYAHELHQKADENAQSIAEQNQALFEAQQCRVQEMKSQVDALTEKIRGVLDQLDSSLAPIASEMEAAENEIAEEIANPAPVLYFRDFAVDRKQNEAK